MPFRATRRAVDDQQDAGVSWKEPTEPRVELWGQVVEDHSHTLAVGATKELGVFPQQDLQACQSDDVAAERRAATFRRTLQRLAQVQRLGPARATAPLSSRRSTVSKRPRPEGPSWANPGMPDAVRPFEDTSSDKP